MDYEEKIDYIYSLHKYDRELCVREEFLNRLGIDWNRLKYVHVGGTNGKGSVVNMVSSIVKCAGYKVGTFTSPHLTHFNERFLIDGKEISDDELDKLMGMIIPVIDNMCSEGKMLGFFDACFAIALKYFADSNVDLAVIEVGVGGKLDPTNIITPLVSVITSVSMDHSGLLGHTVCEIALQKAGIIKRKVPLITGASGEALDIIEKSASDCNAPLLKIDSDIRYNVVMSDLDGQYINVIGMRDNYDMIFLPSLGTYQAKNAAMAIGVCELLRDNNFGIDSEQIDDALSLFTWNARLELLRKENPTVILDCSHNEEGIQQLAEFVSENFADKKILFFMGISHGRNPSEILPLLAIYSNNFIFTKASFKGQDPQELKEALLKHTSTSSQNKPNIFVQNDPLKAISHALIAASDFDLIMITGSIYLAGNLRDYLKNYFS